MAFSGVRRVLTELKDPPQLSATVSKSLMKWNMYPMRPKLPPLPLSSELIKASMPADGDIKITKDGVDLSRYKPASPPIARPKRTVLPHFWLRDNCRCIRCVNQDTNQRNYRTFSLSEDVHALEAHMRNDDLHVTWSDHHRSVYPRAFIAYYLGHDRRPATADLPKRKLWSTWNKRMPPTVLYNKVMDPGSNDFGVSSLTSHIMHHGFVFVSGTPATPEATEKLLERIAFVRVTHYGGFYDFIPDLAKADTAYTNLALPAHTDTTYFTEPAGLQAFHLLSHVKPWEPPIGAPPWLRAPPASDGYSSPATDMLSASAGYSPGSIGPLSVSAEDDWEAFAASMGGSDGASKKRKKRNKNYNVDGSFDFADSNLNSEDSSLGLMDNNDDPGDSDLPNSDSNGTISNASGTDSGSSSTADDSIISDTTTSASITGDSAGTAGDGTVSDSTTSSNTSTSGDSLSTASDSTASDGIGTASTASDITASDSTVGDSAVGASATNDSTSTASDITNAASDSTVNNSTTSASATGDSINTASDNTSTASVVSTAGGGTASDSTTSTTSISDDSGNIVRRTRSRVIRDPELEKGGMSLLVDGFNAAEILREQDPEAFKILATVRLPWHASGNKGITISPDKRYPVIELGEDGTTLHRVRWNNDDRGVVPLEDGGYSAEQWYEAARKFDVLIRLKCHEYWVQLQPGTVLIFDNWRVLHGRSAFVGTRRICGGYINRDDWVSRWRNTTLPAAEIPDIVIG
ncbi:trimethyllysine dioxygenase [Magnaporthiopsis poae ATCC 64411]|uniref:trimethyllysine dioxygenase n=1 Tax=Magnaporthiopsis poae (strain ATCC 64411 / 73-15) TaxID=644358 RepID=A0A0C4E8X3_MAGP6|nr:trimethyllysine dioxygenase [Magnaporthiopsis poae ATCC 64411]